MQSCGRRVCCYECGCHLICFSTTEYAVSVASLGVPCTSCPVAIALIFLARPSFHSRLEHSYTLTQNLGLGLLAPEPCLKSIQAPLRLLRQD